MKTRQALFLAGMNVVFAIVAIRWFEESWRQIGYMMNYVREGGGFGASRDAGVWSLTMYGQHMEINAQIINYPAIFFFILAGFNVLFIFIFLAWNKNKAIDAGTMHDIAN